MIHPSPPHQEPLQQPHQHGRPDGGRVVRAVMWLPGLAVALGAAVATAHGLFEVALASGVPGGIAWLYPLITDGLALVAYTATARLHGRAARYAWSVVILAAGLSGLAQAAYLAGGATLHASPALRFGVGAWPAVAAAVVAHLLYLLADPDHPVPVAVAVPAAPATAEPSTVETAAVQPVEVVEPGTEPTGPPVAAPDARPPVGPAAAQPALPAAVQPSVQREVDRPAAVQPDPCSPLYDATAAALTYPDTGRPTGPRDATVERPAGPVEHPANTTGGLPPRERARAAATRHAARHGALPTVSQLEALAAVSRGTAAVVLKALREHPTPLHLVPDTSDVRPSDDAPQ